MRGHVRDCKARSIRPLPYLHSALLSLAGSRAFILVLQGIELISHRQRHRAGGELIIVGLKHRARVQSAVAVIRPQKVIDVQLQYQAFVKQPYYE